MQSEHCRSDNENWISITPPQKLHGKGSASTLQCLCTPETREGSQVEVNDDFERPTKISG